MTALGVVLILAGAGLLLAEAHVPSVGVLGGAGALCATLGAVLAIAGSGGALAVALPVALVVALCTGSLVAVAARTALTSRRGRARSGAPALVGRVGRVRRWDGSGRTVLVDGALWRALPGHDAEGLHEGDQVVVERVDGLTLSVRRAEEWEVPA